MCPRYSIINFFNHKNFFRPISNVTFWKNICLFWYSYMISSFNFFLIFIAKFNIYVWFYMNRLHFGSVVICIVVFINYVSSVINVHIFWCRSHLFVLWSTEKSYKLLFKEISLCLSFVKSFDTLSRQKLYQLMLSFNWNLQISVLFTKK